MKILIGSDHAGFKLKETIKEVFNTYTFEDFGCYNDDAVDYPDIAKSLCDNMSDDVIGILICGTGNGMSMTANSFPNIRAALCWNDKISALARQHNNANIVILPARFITEKDAIRIVDMFLLTDFEGGRHSNRVDKLNLIKTK